MTTEADVGGVWPPAQGHLEPPEVGRGRKNLFLAPLAAVQPCTSPQSRRGRPP